MIMTLSEPSINYDYLCCFMNVYLVLLPCRAVGWYHWLCLIIFIDYYYNCVNNLRYCVIARAGNGVEWSCERTDTNGHYGWIARPFPLLLSRETAVGSDYQLRLRWCVRRFVCLLGDSLHDCPCIRPNGLCQRFIQFRFRFRMAAVYMTSPEADPQTLLLK